MPNVAKAHQNNYIESLRFGWKEKMTEEIHKNSKIKVVRIHAAGDFYNRNYIKAWHSIVQACPGVTFYAYTRSWKLSEMLPDLVKLADEPNFYMWWSDDKDMPEPPTFAGVRIAYLSMAEDDMPTYPVDLVFRNSGKNDWEPAKHMGPHGSLICPFEQGIERKEKITCEKCGICYSFKEEDGEQVNQEGAEPALVALGGID